MGSLSDKMSNKWGAIVVKERMCEVVAYIVDDTFCSKEDVLKICYEIFTVLDDQDVDLFCKEDFYESLGGINSESTTKQDNGL